MISSYARDAWHTATDEGVTVRDASTGEPVARVSSARIGVIGITRPTAVSSRNSRVHCVSGVSEVHSHRSPALSNRIAPAPE